MGMKITVAPLGYARIATRTLSTPAVAARDEATAAPPPSTLLGILGALNNIEMSCPGQTPEGAEKQLTELAKRLGIRRIWGPLIEIRDKRYAPGLHELYQIELTSSGAAILDVRELRTLRRIGLALRPDKTAEPGHLYSATFVAEEHIRYIYYVDVEKGLRGGVARLGGEGRLAKVEAEQSDLEPPEQVNGHALILTPLLAPGNELPSCIKPIGTLAKTGNRIEVAPKVKIVQWGLGFSEVCRERRPMYPALPPGTIVEARNCRSNEGYLAELGYGALLPTKI